jgi:hypothetical protein
MYFDYLKIMHAISKDYRIYLAKINGFFGKQFANRPIENLFGNFFIKLRMFLLSFYDFIHRHLIKSIGYNDMVSYLITIIQMIPVASLTKANLLNDKQLSNPTDLVTPLNDLVLVLAKFIDDLQCNNTMMERPLNESDLTEIPIKLGKCFGAEPQIKKELTAIKATSCQERIANKLSFRRDEFGTKFIAPQIINSLYMLT